MNFFDRMFLLWHSPTSVAAVLPAGMLQFTIFCFPLGIASYVNTFVAQYVGAGRPQRIGVAVGQAVRFGLCVAPLFLIEIPLAWRLFELIGHSPAIAHQETLYFRITSLGAGAVVLTGALSAFFIGRGKTRVVMMVAVSATTLNAVLDYAWIFGRWGFPEGGIEGAAWATVVAQWYRVAMYTLLILRRENRHTYAIAAGRRYDADLMRRLLKFGAPNGFQMLLECLAFTLFLLLLGRLGESAMVASTLAFNVSSVAFVPILGLGIAVSTVVGQQLGRDRADLAARATWSGLTIGLVYTGVLAAIYVGLPDLFLLAYAAGVQEDFSQIRATTVVLLRFVAAYCLFDAVNIVFASAIKGAGDTRFVLGLVLCVAPWPVTAVWIGTAHFQQHLLWCWSVLTIWIIVLAIGYVARFLQGKWRQMRVIEPTAGDDLDEGPPSPVTTIDQLEPEVVVATN